jgi:hypothetical protein
VSFEEGVGKVLAAIEYWRTPRCGIESIATATRTWFQHMGAEH